MKKTMGVVSYVKSMETFEAFSWNFSSSTNPQIVRSVELGIITRPYQIWLLAIALYQNLAGDENRSNYDDLATFLSFAATKALKSHEM